jgi:hypothetical protein
LKLAEDTDLNRIVRIGMVNCDDLTEDELGQYFGLLSHTMYLVQNWLFQMRTGTLEIELSESWLLGLSGNFHLDGFALFWRERRHLFSDQLQTYVEEIIAAGAQNPNHRPLGLSVRQPAQPAK